MENLLKQKADKFLNELCNVIGERPVGSPGNKLATKFCRDEFKTAGWNVNAAGFEAIDWKEEGAKLYVKNKIFDMLPSPYSLGCDQEGKLIPIENISGLKSGNTTGNILLLYGNIAREQIMPKNFVFYNPDEHKEIVNLLEKSGAKALITATGRNSAAAGGVYPFPMFEDGDFNIPSVYLTEEEGASLLKYAGETVRLVSRAERINSEGFNVIASRNNSAVNKIVITAHIDAKKGTPGAIDNATGVVVLLLLADLLKKYKGTYNIELIAFNGEDYYAVPGQMNYIKLNQADFGKIKLDINIDGAGIKNSKTDISFYNVPVDIQTAAESVMDNYKNMKTGAQWPQGDHSIFVQYGIPAIAVSSSWLIENMESHDITHTPKDNLSIVDTSAVCKAALFIAEFIYKL
jgi:aminopeptidase YwaD